MSGEDPLLSKSTRTMGISLKSLWRVSTLQWTAVRHVAEVISVSKRHYRFSMSIGRGWTSQGEHLFRRDSNLEKSGTANEVVS